jgi:hypothetical protein
MINLNKFKYKIKYFSIKIITENDIISHNNKENPIIPYYYSDIIDCNNYSETLFIRYDFDYIKYESDTGFILENSNIVNAIGFSGLSYSDTSYSKNTRLSAIIDFGIKNQVMIIIKEHIENFNLFLQIQ